MCKTITLLEKKRRKSWDIRLGKDFRLDTTSHKRIFIKGKIDKSDLIKMKNFFSAKYHVKGMKDKL